MTDLAAAPAFTDHVAVAGLRVRYRRRVAVDGLDLTLGRGVHGLLGPNGAGKTTLIRVLATVARPAEGTVRLLGCDLTDARQQRQVRRRLGYLPQDFGYYPRFTVAEFVEYFAWLKEVPGAQIPLAVDRALTRVGLAEVADERMRHLSGGMLRRAGIAQAIVNDPDLLLLDEPTAGLDPEQRVSFRSLLRELGTDTCVVVSTHLVEDVAAACTDVALLESGRLAFSGSTEQLRAAGARCWCRGQPHRARLQRGAAPPPQRGAGVTGPPLRIELRRGAAGLLFAACAAAGVILLFVHPEAWSGRWSALASYLRTELIILAPLAVVFGAWVGGRERRRRLGDLLASTARPRWQPALVAWAALGAAALVAYAVPLAVGAVLVAPTATYGGGGWTWTVAVGGLGLLAAVALGLAVGRLVPLPVAVPVAGVATYVGVGLLSYLPDGSRLQQLSPGGEMLADFDRLRIAGVFGQGAWFVGLTSGLLILAAGRHRSLALLPLGLGLALALPLLAGGRDALYRPDPAARALGCAGSRPQVCLTRVHAYQLGQVTDAVTSVTSSLRGIVSPLPARAVEDDQRQATAG